MYNVELTLDHTLARRGALMLAPRWSHEQTCAGPCNVECQRWANGVNVDSPHWAHVGLTYHYYLGVHWVEFMSLGLPGEFLFCGRNYILCYNSERAVVCDCCNSWKLFKPFHIFSMTVNLQCYYVSALYIDNHLRYFNETSNICKPHLDDMSCTIECCTW